MPLLMPKRVKFRKIHKGRIRGVATQGNRVSFGEYGLQALEAGRITARQIESGRVAANHLVGDVGRLWIRMFPHRSVTAKPAETRMGKGKGEPDHWVACVKPGTMMYEIEGVPLEIAKLAFQRISHRMPIKVRFVQRKHGS